VAIARQLLVDAGSPVYNRRSPADLQTVLREAVRQLDPAAALMP
jgi:hypothetical protein